MEQLVIQTKTTYSSCAFTGHRDLQADFSEKTLKKEIKRLIELGVTTFYTGMAVGFDLIAAELVLSFKKKYGLKLVCCIPFYGQESRFSDRDKKRYSNILKKADEQIVFYQHYTKDCMFKRNRYMVDNADVLITYCKRDTGGTAYTVRYFKQKKPLNEIVYV